MQARLMRQENKGKQCNNASKGSLACTRSHCFFACLPFMNMAYTLGFLNFQILLKFSLLYINLKRKQYLAVGIHKIVRIHCEVVSI